MARPIDSATPEQLEELIQKAATIHDSRIPLVFGVEIPVLVLTIGVVALRFYARTHVKHTLGRDDWVMGGAAIFAIILTTLNCVATRFGAGRHLWDFDLFEYGIVGAKLAYVYAILFTPAVALAKISICMTYLRIFPKRSDRWFAKGMIWWLIIIGIACTILMIVPCVPIEAYWDLTIREKKCYNARRALIITSALNTLTDLAVFLWPAPRLFSLRLPLSQRLGLIFVFSIGCLTCAAGIARIWFIGTNYYRSHDVFYNLSLLYVLSSLDCNLSILCGSLPEIRVFLAPAFDSLFRRNSGRKSLASSHHRGAGDGEAPGAGASGGEGRTRGGSASTGKWPSNAYDLEKSVRLRPDLDDLRDSMYDPQNAKVLGASGLHPTGTFGAEGMGADNSRQVSINVMLDDGSGPGLHGYGNSIQHSGHRSRSNSYGGGGGVRRTGSNMSSRSYSVGAAAAPAMDLQQQYRHTLSQSLSPASYWSSPGRRAEVTESKFSA